MIKLILICWIFGSQNPIPAWRIGESQPPHEEAQSEQSQSAQDETISRGDVFFADCFYGHYWNRDSNNGTNGGQDHSSSDGWMDWLTFLLVVIGASQCSVYVWQATLMRKSIDHAKESSERGLRAYLSIINVAHGADREQKEAVADFPTWYHLFIKNDGQTPAYEVSTHLTWKYINGVDADWPENEPFLGIEEIDSFDTDKIKSTDTIGGGNSIKCRRPLHQCNNPLNFALALAFVGRNEGVIFMYGTVVYKDAYKRDRFTNFCFIVRQVSLHKVEFATYKIHNDAN